MFLYKPQTEEQIVNLIFAYQTIIDNPKLGIINLLLSDSHYRYYFIGRHEKNNTWNRILKWAGFDDQDSRIGGRIGGMIMYTIVFGLFSYYGLCWLPYALKILINYRKIRQEAPINLLELG